MRIQKSYKMSDANVGDINFGTLYLVATPIGNLEDITLRALKVLREVDTVACEDTRQTLKLLNHYEILKPLISYYQHNQSTSGDKLISLLLEGKDIALVSDAGTPAISDPGYELVQMAIDEGISVVPIPGANAAISGLIASGIATEQFVFIGFLSRESKVRAKELDRLRSYPETLIFYEAPHRIRKTVEAIVIGLGDRRAVLVRELSKIHEEFIRGQLSEIAEYLKENEIRGELTLVVASANQGLLAELAEAERASLWWQGLSPKEHVEHYLREGFDSKTAVKQAALDRGVPKKEVYAEYHIKRLQQ